MADHIAKGVVDECWMVSVEVWVIAVRIHAQTLMGKHRCLTASWARERVFAIFVPIVHYTTQVENCEGPAYSAEELPYSLPRYHL